MLKTLPWAKHAGYDGHLSIECEGQGGPLLEKSLPDASRLSLGGQAISDEEALRIYRSYVREQ